MAKNSSTARPGTAQQDHIMDHDEAAASADGILHCLRLLAEEAASLRLSGTFWAIERALATITEERSALPQGGTSFPRGNFPLH